MLNKERIVIVGAGLMGIGIAQVFASAGHQVTLVDVATEQLAKVASTVSQILDDFERFGLPFGGDRNAVLQRIQTSLDMETACRDCDVAFEAVYENMDLKQAIVAELDRYCPSSASICSNTSVMSITEIASKAEKRERILGTHWWNPPYLIPLVEVVHTEASAATSAEKIYDLLERVGKKPIHVRKDVPGFVANRLQHALWREAFALIDNDICDAGTVDEAIKSGFGLRLPVLGPVENADMVGLDLTLAIHDYILPHLTNDAEPSATLKAAVAEGHLGFKSGKGFLSWSETAIAASKARLGDYLLALQVKQ